MFLARLTIEKDGEIIRDIPFYRGINLIVDETHTSDKRESGNSVGKTTVLRLIDFCLGGEGRNIYEDSEFRNKTNQDVEGFLKSNNVLVTLLLREKWEDEDSNEVLIERNFLNYGKKIQRINGEKYNNPEFLHRLKELIFDSTTDKPTFRQIIAKNIRDEKYRLIHTVKVLHQTTTIEEYEAVYLFWLGINLDDPDRKHKLITQKKIENNLQKRLRTESNLSQIAQSLLVVDRTIQRLATEKDDFEVNKQFAEDLAELTQVKDQLNRLLAEKTSLELRRDLIEESREDLEADLAAINPTQIEKLYEEAKQLLPTLQRTFQETLNFHNRMIREKVSYITEELPALDEKIASLVDEIEGQLAEEKRLSEKLSKTVTSKDFEAIVSELNQAYERKGRLREQKRLWESSIAKVESIENELAAIDDGITSKDDLIQERIAEFNKFFADISNRLYGEQFVLSADRNERGYELRISSISGNLGTGKKKGEMAAFDLAYIQFADSLKIPCVHFILQDQIENVHDNQISELLTEIVSGINCQYVLPVLRDKLPGDLEVEKYQILSLSQDEKLFKV
jgi:uncharacterized protein YydD (DUF2326 family)